MSHVRASNAVTPQQLTILFAGFDQHGRQCRKRSSRPVHDLRDERSFLHVTFEFAIDFLKQPFAVITKQRIAAK